MKKYYYELVIENGERTFNYLDTGLSKRELEISQNLKNIMDTARRLMVMERIVIDSFLKLKSVNFQELKKLGDTDQVNELVINFVSNAKLFIDYLDTRWAPKYIPNFYSDWKKVCSKFYDEDESYRLCYHLRNFVQHSGMLPISKVVEEPGSNRSVRTIFELNIDSFKDFKKEFKKLNINESYWNHIGNLSFMQHAKDYIGAIIVLYKIALVQYIKNNLSLLDKIYNEAKNTKLKTTICWTYISPQDTEAYIAKNKFTVHPITTLIDLNNFYRELKDQGIIEKTKE